MIDFFKLLIGCTGERIVGVDRSCPTSSSLSFPTLFEAILYPFEAVKGR